MKAGSLAVSGLVIVAAVLVTTGARPRAPRAGAVSGQVSIKEREGEVTEDLANVVVFLEPKAAPGKAKAIPSTKSVMALQSRQFSPRVRVVMQGSTIEFPNQDPFNHNVFSKVNGGFDTGVYGRGKVRDQVFRDAGVYSLYCNVHPRMTAFVVALNTPYFTQAGTDGRFVIGNVPPGDYAMHVWHDRATEMTRDVTVSASGAAGLRLELDARGYKYVQHKNKLGKDYPAGADRY